MANAIFPEEGRILFQTAGPDTFYVRSDCETGTLKYVGMVRRVTTGYRNGNPIIGWQRIGKWPEWPDNTYKRRIDAARALM